MTTLCGWLFRAKKSPWNTSGFGCTLAEAGARYLEVATSLQQCITLPVLCVFFEFVVQPNTNKGQARRCAHGNVPARHPQRDAGLTRVLITYAFVYLPHTLLAQERYGGDFRQPAELHQGDGYPGQSVQVSWMHTMSHRRLIMRPLLSYIIFARFHSKTFSWSRWCAWAHTSKRFQMTASLLLILWAAMEAPGLGPNHLLLPNLR